jgi:hypothetical protein
MNTRSEVCRALAHLTQKETSLDFVNICVRNHIYTNGIEKVINSINERGYGPSISSIITEKQKTDQHRKIRCLPRLHIAQHLHPQIPQSQNKIPVVLKHRK